MTNFPDDDVYPWTTVVYITARFGSSYSQGSGVLVGRNDVLTASHVIYDTNYGIADEVFVYPSYEPTESPIKYEGVKYRYYDDYDPDGDGRLISGDGNLDTLEGTEKDVALITLEVPAGDVFGWMGMDYKFNTGIMNASGYPGVENGYLYTQRSYAYEDDIDYFIHLDDFILNPGNSGGPVWYEGTDGPYTIGVVSTTANAVDLSVHDWLSDEIVQNNSYLIRSPLMDLHGLVFATAQNIHQFEGLAAAYHVLLGGVPSIEGFSYLISNNNSTNFGSYSSVTFNEENIFINVMNALYQGNSAARAEFSAIVSGGSLRDKLSSVYDYVVHWSQRTAAGEAAFVAQSDFYALRAAELGIPGSDGAALVGMAALIKIAVTSDLMGIGDGINDLHNALANNSASLWQSGRLTRGETADGTQFDGDDGAMARVFLEADEPFNYLGNGDAVHVDDSAEIALIGFGDVGINEG